MYPRRSDKHKQRKLEKQRRQNRMWVLINLTLISLIIVLGTYFYLEERTRQDSARNGAEQAGDDLNIALGNQGNNETPEVSSDDSSSGNENSGEGDAAANDGAALDPDEPGVEETPDPDGAKTESGAELLIHFAGDTIFSGKVEEQLEKTGYDYPYKYVQDLFQNDDLSVLNLETPITAGGEAAENKTFVFKSPPKALGPMAAAGVDAVNLANNHVLDQGVPGLKDTLKNLRKNGILYVGAGENSKEAYAPVYVERKGVKIALFGFSRVIPEYEWTALKKHPGVAAVYDPEPALAAIREARKQADLVLVVAHWGKERVTELEDHQQELAHAFIDAGADLVIGGHPHVMQGLEEYKGKWIAYSTGNFIFTKSLDQKTWETAVFAAKCTREGDCSLQLIPYRTELGQPVPMAAEDGKKLLEEVESLSPGVTIDEKGDVSASG
ncbi:CapA family protein [Paenibacillus sp. TH7-28]